MGNTKEAVRPFSELMLLLRQAVKTLNIDLSQGHSPHPGTIQALIEVSKELTKHQAIYEELLSQATNTAEPKQGWVEFMNHLARP